MIRSIAVFLFLFTQQLLGNPDKPNVIALLADDLGYRDLGCYGGPVKTPVLDKLAAGGVRFTDFHSGAPSCSPSRATFLTGRNHRRTGVYSVITERLHKMHLLESETTIAEVLKENGYATAHFGKWHLGMPVHNRENPTPGGHGFDYWFGLVNGPGPSHKNPTQFLRNGKRVGQMEGYSCQLVVDEALTWLDDERDGDEPFFLNLWFNEPHAPIAAPDEIVSQYGALDDQAAIYSGTIDNTDRAIGRLVARLEKLGELDNTIIIYSSDNGSYRQERSGELRGKKGALFEGGHRVPGIFYWKGGIPGGRVEDELAGAVDLLPTICGLIGIDKPEGVHLDGSDLAPLLTQSDNFTRHQPLFWTSESNMVMRVGDHTLFASSTAKSPIDFKTADRLTEQIQELLGDDLEEVLDGMELRSRLFNGRLPNHPEAERLRNQLRDMFYFQESWIPELKRSGLGGVQLYDLSKDLGQENNIAKQRPELAARLKEQAAAIHRSVMADAPEWLTPEELAAAKKPAVSSPRQSAPAAAKALADPKTAMRAKLKAMVSAGKFTEEESMELYLAAFPEEEANVEKMRTERANDVETRQELETEPGLGWNRFRGPNGSGVAESAEPPVAIDESHLAWKTETPGGLSSPVLSKDRVFLTAHDGEELVVLAYSKKDGRLLWRKAAPAPPSETVHEAGSQAASTPFVDSNRVYAYFGSFGLVCFDHDGKELWKKPIPTPKSMYGMSTSPIGFGETIVLVLDDDRNLPDSELSRSKMIAVDRATGETVWETERPFNRSGWSTPMISNEDLVVLGNGRLEAYNPATGESKWWISGFSRETISSPIAGAGMVFGSASKQGGSGDVDTDPAPFWNALKPFDTNEDGQIQRVEMTGHFTFPFRPELPLGHPGFGMPLPNDESQRAKRIDHMLTWFDKNEDDAWSREEFEAGFQVGRGRPLLAAVAPGGSGDVTGSHVRWEVDRSIPEIPTPIFHEGLIYLIRKGGILTAIDATSGELVYRERINDAGGQYAASPVIANGHLILVSSLGQISIVRTGREFELVHQFALEETTETTPAIDGNTIFIRSAGHLHAFRRQPKNNPVSMLLDRSCLDCHDRDTNTPIDLEMLAFDLTEPENFRRWEKVFDQIESGAMPPENKPRPDQQLLTAAMSDLHAELREASLAQQARNGRVPVRRLTRTEYEYTMHDLLGIGGNLASKLPPENDSSSFDTVANDQGISPVHIKSYLAAANLALDEAIQLGPKPNSAPREIDYKNHSYVKMWFERDLRRGGNTVKRTADAFVTFDGRPHTTQTDNMGIKFPVAGKYRIEAEVFGYQAKTPVTFCIYRANDIDGITEMIGHCQIDPGESRDVELTSYFSTDDYFYLVPEDLDHPLNGETIFHKGAKTYPGEGVGVRRLSLEGPLESEWPPTRTRQLLGDLESQQEPLARITNIISRIGPRAFRWPLRDDEATLWASFAKPALDDGRGFEAGLRVALRAMLSSPDFLYFQTRSFDWQSKPGNDRDSIANRINKLDDFALAARLSYFLWKSLPDDRLFLLANEGTLRNPDVLKNEVDRMLDDEKAQRFVSDFLGQWLELDEIDATTPDDKLYVDYDDVLRQAMLDETEHFFAELIWNDLGVRNLIDSDFTFLNRRLAEHYGIPGVEGLNMRKVQIPADSPRGGLLTQASILKVTANGTTTSPVMRGAFVLSNLLGRPSAPPPPGIGAIEPDTRGATTIREELAAHRNVDSCAKCHRHIDPPGFALESFDPIGGYRTRYRASEGDVPGHKLHGRAVWEYKLGQPVDASGVTAKGVAFAGIREFKQQLLAEEEQVARQLISQLIAYSTGAEIQFADREELERIVAKTRESDFGVRGMIHEIVQSQIFRNK